MQSWVALKVLIVNDKKVFEFHLGQLLEVLVPLKHQDVIGIENISWWLIKLIAKIVLALWCMLPLTKC